MSKTKETVVCYTKVKPINKKFLVKKHIETGQTMSDCMDAFLDHLRTGKPLKIKTIRPKYVERAERVTSKKRLKMEALADKAKGTIKSVKAKTRKPTKRKKNTEVQATA